MPHFHLFAVGPLLLVLALPQPQREEFSEQAKALAHFERLGVQVYYDADSKEIYINELRTTDADLKYLAQLPELKEVYLMHLKKVTDEGMAQVLNLKRLETLHVSVCPKLTKGFVKQLPSLRFLRLLSIEGIELADDDLITIGKIDNLRSLYINGKFSDGGLKPLAQLSNLAKLSIDTDVATGAGFCSLSKLLELTSLSFSTRTRERLDLSCLSQLTRLRYLGIDAKNIRVNDLVHFATLQNLRKLELHGMSLKGGLRFLPPLPLEELCLYDVQVDDDTLAGMPKLPALTHLEFSKCPLTDRAVEFLLRYKGLTSLSVADSSITDQGLLRLAENPNLRFIDAHGTAITARGKAFVELLRPDLHVYAPYTITRARRP